MAIEVVSPRPVLDTLLTEGPWAEYGTRGIEATNLTLLVVPEFKPLAVWLAVLDGERVMLSPADHSQTPELSTAGIAMGRDPALVAWCEQLYERYRDRARSPARQVIGDLKERLAESVPAVSRPSEE